MLLLKDFNEAVLSKEYFTYSKCNERRLRDTKDRNNSRCTSYSTKGKKAKRRDYLLNSRANNMRPGDLPALDALTDTEEMLIARVHPILKFVLTDRGVQQLYSGYVAHFL
ncbi:hypothetical protein TI39_contig760g00001 [Zymoseptoria brevis]|uniref:DUF6570 domain-containing protein n=1 Tax=Zymoseptoria brevis TaxID=1047168 RepID=A0A0F4GFV0_9PEZI|nr:hypothetical protein TI39_contig760g00001 [Zymoseptoria brevis]